MEHQSIDQARTAVPNTFPVQALERSDMPPASRRGAQQLQQRNAVATYLVGQDPTRSARDHERWSWPNNQFLQQPSIVRK